jgi:type I restriction-modification system DNA methylase subunit
MKVIQPLFLDELRTEYENNLDNPDKLKRLLGRIVHMRIFDPACGSGNFLIISYKELRRLEMEILSRIQDVTKQTSLI